MSNTHGLKRRADYTEWDYRSAPDHVVIGTHADGAPAVFGEIEIGYAPGECSEAEAERIHAKIESLLVQGLTRVGFFDRQEAASE